MVPRFPLPRIQRPRANVELLLRTDVSKKVSASFTADDVRNFVSKMSARVCLVSKRNREKDTATVHRLQRFRTGKRFVSALTVMMLNDRKWPAHVNVSKWFLSKRE